MRPRLLDAGCGTDEVGRDVSRRRRAGRASAGHQGHRGLGRLHRRASSRGRAQARTRGRRLFPAVLHLGGRLRSGKTKSGVPWSRRPRPSEARVRRDFTPLAIGTGGMLEKVPSSSPATASRPGTAAQSGLDYDDYAGVDVKGKAVLILRREPQQHDDASPFDGKNDPRSRPFSTRRPTRSSTGRRRSPGQQPGRH